MTPTAHKSPVDLAPGDLVLVDDAWAQVVEEPLTMHSGTGIFDDLHVFVGARVRRTGVAGTSLCTWELDDRVPVRDPGPAGDLSVDGALDSGRVRRFAAAPTPRSPAYAQSEPPRSPGPAPTRSTRNPA